jgi:hypothetical protein
MRALPLLSLRGERALRRGAAALCLVLALTAWLRDRSAAPACARPQPQAGRTPGETVTTVPVIASAARLARPGDRVDLVAPRQADTTIDETTAPSAPTVVAERVRIVQILTSHDVPGHESSVDLVVATNRATALRIAAALRSAPFAVITDPP